MPSATLTSDVPRSKRFHQPWWRGRIVMGLVWLGIATGHIFAGHGPYHVVEGVLWTCFGIVYCASGLSVWWELRVEGLLRRSFWANELIPYSDITSVEQLEDMTHPIEVQYFSTSPNTFPRKKMTVGTFDRQHFIDALRELAPNAEFRA